jgi:hypothetical protein
MHDHSTSGARKCRLQIRGAAIRNLQFAICNLQFLTAALWLGTQASADIFELANGGRIDGRVVETADGDQSKYVIDLAGGGRLTIPRSDVARVDATSPSDDEYLALARRAPDTVAGHWKLVEWCREHRLRDRAGQHLERILELDPSHEEARMALGFRHKDGQWVTRDDVMANRGMLMYEGRYVTPQHIELLKRLKETKTSQADWANTFERLRRWLTGRREERFAQAHAELQTIRDPLAAAPLIAMLRREQDPELRRLWVDVAAGLDHQLAVDALVDLSLTDPEAEIRYQCLESLIKSGRSGLAVPYIRALRDRDNAIVNRAGAALGQLGNPEAAGALIDALVTKHRFKTSDANPDQHAYTFSPDSGSFSFGGGGPQVVTREIRNPDVLGALVTLAGGTSFDYDQEQWRRWLAAQTKLNAVDVRRDE